MTAESIKLLLEFAADPKLDGQTFSRVQCTLSDAMRATCTKDDADAFELLLDKLLIYPSGQRRSPEGLRAFTPIIVALCQDKDQLRLADIENPKGTPE